MKLVFVYLFIEKQVCLLKRTKTLQKEPLVLMDISCNYHIVLAAKVNFYAFESYSHSSINCKPKPSKHYHQMLYFMCNGLIQVIEVENYVHTLFIPPGLESNQSMEI